jgi:hypothetical protein
MDVEDMALNVGTDRNDGESIDIPYPSTILNKHVAILGTTGSGKTVAAKVLIEEAVLNGIPSVVIDPQGDLAQLAKFATDNEIEEAGGNLERFSEFKDMVEVRIWTPAHSCGLPICINPFTSPPTGLEEEDRISTLDLMAAGFAAITGYNVEKPPGSLIKAYLVQILDYAEKCNKFPDDFNGLANLVEAPYSLQKLSGISEKKFQNSVVDLVKDSQREELTRRLRAQETGVKNLMFTMGMPLDFDVMVQPYEEGKIPINILFLNTLNSDEMKQGFLLEFTRRLYEWLPTKGKSESDTHLMFFIDEVAPYIPPHPRNPPSKEMFKRLFSQGRKYGLSCVLATQNIKDVDYKILAQANTRFHGKVMSKHDKDSIQNMLKSTPNAQTHIDAMSTLNAGEFLLICNDAFGDSLRPVDIRWLYTIHEKRPWDEHEIKALYPKDSVLREWAKQFENKKKKVKSKLRRKSSKIENEKQSDEIVDIDDQHFEMDLFGGLLLLRDSRDQLSVMLGLTNLITTLVLLASTVSLTLSWIETDIGGIVALFTIIFSSLTASILISEIISGGEYELLQKIRQRARPFQNLAMIWVWVLWFLEESNQIEFSEIMVLGIEVAAVSMTLFFLVEWGHRVKLGRIEWPSGSNPLKLIKGGIGSLTKSVTSTEIHTLRATSKELLDGWRMIANLAVILTICNILGWINIPLLDEKFWLRSLLTVTSLLLISQFITYSRDRISQE